LLESKPLSAVLVRIEDAHLTEAADVLALTNDLGAATDVTPHAIADSVELDGKAAMGDPTTAKSASQQTFASPAALSRGLASRRGSSSTDAPGKSPLAPTRRS